MSSTLLDDIFNAQPPLKVTVNRSQIAGNRRRGIITRRRAQENRQRQGEPFNSMEILNPIGEIVESSTTSFVAQCLELPRQNEPRLYDPPAFGSFVKIGPPGRPPTPELQTSTATTASTLVFDDEPDPFADTPAPAPVDTSTLPAAVYALVVGASTASLEPNRRPSALGYEDEDELRRHQPQIFELLRTDFTGLLIAYSAGDGKGLRRHLPPVPPRIATMMLSSCVAKTPATAP